MVGGPGRKWWGVLAGEAPRALPHKSHAIWRVAGPRILEKILDSTSPGKPVFQHMIFAISCSIVGGEYFGAPLPIHWGHYPIIQEIELIWNGFVSMTMRRPRPGYQGHQSQLFSIPELPRS